MAKLPRAELTPPAKPTLSAQIKLDSDFDLNLNNAADPSAVS